LGDDIEVNKMGGVCGTNEGEVYTYFLSGNMRIRDCFDDVGPDVW